MYYEELMRLWQEVVVAYLQAVDSACDWRSCEKSLLTGQATYV
jgi:hypothetical protein